MRHTGDAPGSIRPCQKCYATASTVIGEPGGVTRGGCRSGRLTGVANRHIKFRRGIQPQTRRRRCGMKVVTILALSLALLPAAATAQSTVAATGGNITITPLQHASVQ